MVHQREFLRGLVRPYYTLYSILELTRTSHLAEQGVEKKVELDNLSSSDVSSQIAKLLGLA